MLLFAFLLAGTLAAPAYDNVHFPTSVGYLDTMATAGAPMLAQTNPAAPAFGKPTSSYTLPQPIETSVQCKDHKSGDRNMFTLLGNLSPYYVSSGWGVFDYAFPKVCKISELHLLSRHGSRYPTSTISLGETIKEAKGNKTFGAKGELSFLTDWEYNLGVNLLTKLGNQQLFDKGVRSFFRYGKLFDWENATKIVSRTTSQDRITKSAEYFLTGFFGMDWQDYVNLEILIENSGFNDTLAPYDYCENYELFEKSSTSTNSAAEFKAKYTKDAVNRVSKLLKGVNVTSSTIVDMQDLCAYEANNLGYSAFCSVFTQKEWEDYEYYKSWTWYNDNSFGAPMARGMGIGWVEEFRQRLLKSSYDPSRQAVQNSTLDKDPMYFPTNQTLYLDFTHDSVITNIITALGLQQFKSNFTVDGKLGSKESPFDMSTVVPFASQIYFEVIECDAEISADRLSEPAESGNSTKYVHMLLNDHTIDLSLNMPEYCESRKDGWCKFDEFVDYLTSLWDVAQFDKACFGEYDYTKLSDNGTPV